MYVVVSSSLVRVIKEEEDLDTEDQDTICCPFSQYKGLSVGISKRGLPKRSRQLFILFMGKGGVLLIKFVNRSDAGAKSGFIGTTECSNCR